MTIRVNAFGKTIAFPAGTSPEEIEKHISSNRSLLDPDYTAPSTTEKLKQFGREFAQDSLGINMGLDGRTSGVVGLLGNVNRGAKQTGRMVGAASDTIGGDLSGVEKYGESSREAAQNETPEEQMRLLQELQQIDRDKSIIGQIGDTLGAAGRNKMGTAQLITEQLPNTAVSLGGGYAGFKAGAAAGALFGPAGVGVGGALGFLSGMFLGNTLLETGSKAIEKSEGGFTADERDEALKEGAIKGGVITGVDALTLGIGGKVTGALSRSAERAGARAEAKTLMDAGVDMSSLATINQALAANPALRKTVKLAGEKAAISSMSASRKVGIAGTGVALETVGEGAGEYFGEMAATGNPDVVDATIEALAGMSQSAIEATYNFNKIGSRHNLEDVQKQATKINEERTKLGLNKIASSGSVDEAINAAAETVAQKPVTSKDIWDDQAARDDLLMRAEQINQQKGVQNEAQVQGTETPAAETNVLDPKSAETLLNQAVANDGSNSMPSAAQLDKDSSESDIIAQNLGNAAKGAATEIILPDNTTLPAEWMVVDADNVKATMKNGVNQPRDRTRAAADVQIQQIANQPDYRRMSDSPVMDIGAPTLSSDGAIVGGNGRFEGVSRGYDAGTSAAYRSSLEADAISKGIDPATFAGMKKPVLVRRVTQPFDTQKLAVASNSGGSLEYSALERAKIDAERIGDIDQIDVTDSGDIALTKDNAANIRGVLKGYSAAELGSFVDNEGNLSQEGSRRLKNAILYSAYGNSKTLSRMVESTDTDMRNIVGALTKTAGQAARVRKNISQGGLPKSLDITDNLIEAVEKIGQIRSSGDTVDNYLTQGELFSDIALSEETKEIMTGLSDVMRSQKRMTEFLRATYDLIEKVDVTTENIFGEPDIPKKLEVVKHAKKQTAEQRPGSLFGEETGTKSATKIHNVTSTEAGAKYSRSPEERLKDREKSRKLERALQREGYEFRIQARDVRLGITPDGKGQEAIAAEQIARVFRKRISWIEADGDFKINGVMVPNIPDTIFIDVNTNKAAHIVMGHELSHHMEQDVPEVYQAMVDALMPMIRDVDAYHASRKLDDMKQENVIKEIVGDIMGDNFADPEFWNKVAAYNPNAFRKIADTIISWIKRLVTNAKARGLGSQQWVTDAQKAQDIVAKAVSQYTYTESSFDGLKNKPMFQTAWHGSPHDHDKFDVSKIGTGEGAQAYGYGLYFTSAKGVAEYYRDNVRDLAYINQVNKRLSELVHEMDKYRAGEYGKFNDPKGYELKAEYERLLEEKTNKKGRLYQVELTPEPDEYLLWDKPLSEQTPVIKNSIDKVIKDRGYDLGITKDYKDEYTKDLLTGERLYKFLARSTNNKRASEYLYSLGIRGIKYLDGSSRGGSQNWQEGLPEGWRYYKEGDDVGIKNGNGLIMASGYGTEAEAHKKVFGEKPSFNYVIFDDKDVEITAKFSKQGGLDLDSPINKTTPKDDLQLESQNLKGNTNSKNPSGVIKELDYDNIPQRPGTTEKQRDAGRNAYQQLLERIVSRGQGRLLGSSIAKNFREGQGAELVGQRVESSEDLAVLAQVLRDPRFETFRIFYVKDGAVVHHTGVSSRMPASSRVFKVSDGVDKFFESINDSMRNLKADGYYLLHNHPSGKATPSSADINLTEEIERNVPGFISHVIIDHNEYGEISIERKGISKKTISDVKYRDMPGNKNLQPMLPHKILGSKVSRPLDIVLMGKQVQRPDGYFTVIGLAAQMNVVSLSEFPSNLSEKPDVFLLGLLRRYARNSGAHAVAVVIDNKLADNPDFINGLVRTGLKSRVLLDVINSDTGFSYAQDSAYIGGREIFDKGKAYERVYEVQESDAKYDVIQKKGKVYDFNGQSKVKTEDIFNAPQQQPKNEDRQKADKLIENGEFNDLPIETIQTEDLVPTQKWISSNNLNKVKHATSDTNAHILKSENKYYILDGHHRIAVNIVNNEKSITAHVLDIDRLSSRKNVSDRLSMPESIPDTITIDGKERPTRNSNGKLIHPTEEGIRNFWEWFGESEVVDKEGKPKVVYHGSNKDNISNFDPALSRDIGIHFSEKDLSKKFGGIKYEAYLKIENSASILDIFSVDGSGYEVYSRQVPGAIDTALDLLADQSDDLYDLGHKVENSWSDDREAVNVKSRPYKKFWKEVSKLAKEVGVDGFEYINRYEGGGHSYAVFSPNQIKSATDNTGQFSIKSDDVRFSKSDRSESIPDTITIDGKERPARNGNGKLIHPTEEGIRNFWKWFGNSKIVDDDGRPLVVYHGAPDARFVQQDGIFKGTNERFGRQSSGKDRVFWFAKSRSVAKTYADDRRAFDYQAADPGVIDAYLKLENPLVIDAKGKVWREAQQRGKTSDVIEQAQEEGRDGVIIKNVRDNYNDWEGGIRSTPTDTYVVFSSEQIKSATGNTGQFSPESDDIRFSRSETLSQAGVNTEESANPSGLPEETKTQAFRRRSQDAMLRFKVVQNWLKEQGVSLSEAANVYQRENISKGKTANRIEDFRREQLEPLIKRIAETSKKATGEGKFDLADIATYLEAVHIPEANERMRTIHKDDKATANGITDDQARKVVKQFESMPNFAEFKELANQVRKIGIDTLDMRLDAGLISQEQYDAYKSTYKNWVPLRGNMSKQGFGKGMSTNAKDKRRMGHGFREEEFVIENLVQDRERAIMQIEKNKVGLSVAEFLMEAMNPNIGTVGNPEKMRVMKDFSYAVTFKGRAVGSFETEAGAKRSIDRIMERKGDLLPEGESFTQTDFSIAKSYDPHIVMMARPQLAENEIQVYVNGHAVRLQLNDIGLARAATNAGIEQVGAIAHGARMFNRFLSKAYTAWSPDFLFMNMARDAYSGTLVLTGKKGAAFAAKAFANYGTAIKELIKGRNDPKQSEWVTRYRAAGGNIGAAYLSDLERVGEDAVAALQEFAGARETYRMVYNEQISKGASVSKARTMAALKAGVAKTKAAPVIGHLFKMLERTNMVIENALRLATFKTAVESGESDQQAAMLSKDLMNFNRKGEIANQMGALYLFYNPGMQGAHIVGEALFTSKHRKQVWSLLGALTTLSFILAEFARGGEDDDDREWENTPDYIKDRNLIFQFGDKQITVPVAYGFGIFHAMGNYLSDLNHGADKSEVAVKLASGMFENFSVFGNPIVGDDGNTEIRMDQVLPTLPKLIMAPGINMDSLGRQIHPVKYQDSVPDSQLMWRSVRGTAYEDIAHFMNDITGGSQYNPGAIDISPNTIKYWVTALTGGAGRFVSDITTGSLNATEGIAPEIENVPVLRKFIREPGVSDSRGAFHKARKEAQNASERFNKALKNGDVFLSQQMLDENHEIIALANYAKQANKMASEARDAIMQIQLDKDVSKAEKKVRIKEIELQERKVYDIFLEIFDKAKNR